MSGVESFGAELVLVTINLRLQLTVKAIAILRTANTKVPIMVAFQVAISDRRQAIATESSLVFIVSILEKVKSVVS